MLGDSGRVPPADAGRAVLYENVDTASHAAPRGSPPGGQHDVAPRHRTLLRWVMRSGLLIALAVAIAVFGIARPSSFLTINDMKSILLLAAVPTVLAVGLTVPLALGDFDLSIGAMFGLGGASAVAMMSLHGWSWQAAVLVALVIAVIAGSVTGYLVAYLKGSSFIMTLAMATILLGVEYLFTHQNTLYTGIQPGYIRLGQSNPFWGINVTVWFALAAAVVGFIFLEKTEAGRYMYAIGGNAEASRYAGLSVRRLRFLGFVIVAVAAAVAGILYTAQGASSSPDAGVPFLLPAYAAAFLGTTLFRPGMFNVVGTVVAVVFLTVIQTGLQMLHIGTAVIDILQGAILIVAVLLSRLEQRQRS